MSKTKATNPKDAVGIKKWRQFMTLPMQVFWEVGVAMLEGTLKYGRHNYRGAGVRASVYVDAARGHIEQWVEGEDIDKDSDMSHITKAIASLTVLRDAMMNDCWVDDRPPPIKDMDGLRNRLQKAVERNFELYGDVHPHHWTQADEVEYNLPSIDDRCRWCGEPSLSGECNNCLKGKDNADSD